MFVIRARYFERNWESTIRLVHTLYVPCIKRLSVVRGILDDRTSIVATLLHAHAVRHQENFFHFNVCKEELQSMTCILDQSTLTFKYSLEAL